MGEKPTPKLYISHSETLNVRQRTFKAPVFLWQAMQYCAASLLTCVFTVPPSGELQQLQDQALLFLPPKENNLYSNSLQTFPSPFLPKTHSVLLKTFKVLQYQCPMSPLGERKAKFNFTSALFSFLPKKPKRFSHVKF